MKCPCSLVLTSKDDPCLECPGLNESKEERIGKQRASARQKERVKDDSNIRGVSKHLHTRL